MTNKTNFGKLTLYRLMDSTTQPRPQRVLIASANPLFREGLRKMYAARWGDRAVVIGMPSTMEETLTALEELSPDLVIVDHDDITINRDEFLERFMEGESPMQVVLVSLGSTEPVVLYQRKRFTAAQAESWLSNPWG
jgi:chemotaxis response regulator CheB